MLFGFILLLNSIFVIAQKSPSSEFEGGSGHIPSISSITLRPPGAAAPSNSLTILDDEDYVVNNGSSSPQSDSEAQPDGAGGSGFGPPALPSRRIIDGSGYYEPSLGGQSKAASKFRPKASPSPAASHEKSISSILSHTLVYHQLSSTGSTPSGILFPQPLNTSPPPSTKKQLDIGAFTRARTSLPKFSVLPVIPMAESISTTHTTVSPPSPPYIFRTSIRNVIRFTTPNKHNVTTTIPTTITGATTYPAASPPKVRLTSPPSYSSTPTVVQLQSLEDPVKSNEIGSLIGTKEDVEKRSRFHIFTRPEILATAIGGVCIALLCAILLILFVIYRLRKKDEGSYALDETKRALHHPMLQPAFGAGGGPASGNTYASIPPLGSTGPLNSPYSRGGRGPPPIKSSLSNKEFYA